MFYNGYIQKERRESAKETLKNLKETNERRKVKMRKMFKNKKRNHANSFGCNNSSAFDISGSNNKFITR